LCGLEVGFSALSLLILLCCTHKSPSCMHAHQRPSHQAVISIRTSKQLKSRAITQQTFHLSPHHTRSHTLQHFIHQQDFFIIIATPSNHNPSFFTFTIAAATTMSNDVSTSTNHCAITHHYAATNTSMTVTTTDDHHSLLDQQGTGEHGLSLPALGLGTFRHPTRSASMH